MSTVTRSLKPLIQAAAATIDAHAAEVTVLDQAIGDGDHVVNLQRGLAALERVADEADDADWAAAFQKIGMSLMSTVGGASGSLYGTLFLAMAKAFKELGEMNLPNFAMAFGRGVEAMKQRGKAEVGEKTMLDTLVPVAAVLLAAAAESAGLPETLDRVEAAAVAGAESTRDLVATKGRASFLGERARGHLDPGARTAQLMVAALAGVLTGSWEG
jgi:dihydroxyacetone kinase-like protein